MASAARAGSVAVCQRNVNVLDHIDGGATMGSRRMLRTTMEGRRSNGYNLRITLRRFLFVVMRSRCGQCEMPSKRKANHNGPQPQQSSVSFQLARLQRHHKRFC